MTYPYLRLFAPFYFGNPDLEYSAFSFLLENLQKDHKFHEYFDIRVNLSNNSKFLKHFQHKNQFFLSTGKPKYYYKFLNENPKLLPTDDSFFDPRDV